MAKKKESDKSNSNIIHSEYKAFLEDIKSRIREANYKALKAVNNELIQLYWDIGKQIVEKQEQKAWGKSVVENLAQDLQKEFAGSEGYSARNLWRMRSFYLTYKDNVKLPPLVAEIGWTHNVVIMEKCKDDLQKEFYIRATKKFGWTKNVLIHQIDNQSYEKYLLNQTNFDKAVSETVKAHAYLAVKDEYCSDTNGLCC